MKEFPKHLNAKYRERFPELYYNRIKCYARKTIYEHIISHEAKDYYSLDEFNTSFHTGMEMTQKIIRELIPELEKLGWTCKLSFGDTGLFIYTGDKPENLWE
jgi:hypothetical protein